MGDLSLGAAESRFADIIWENQPISSTELAKRSEQILGWKKSTTYTVLKRLCEKQIFQNNKGTVTALISKADFSSQQSERFVQQNFNGSLPAFLAAFTARKSLTDEEISQLRQLVEQYEEKK